jgi:hypothetical protein
MRGPASLTIKRARFEERISRFAALYGADRHWQRGLFPRGKSGRVLSADLTPLLVRENHQLVVIFGAFYRTGEIQGRHVLYFDEATTLESQLGLFLECSSEQAQFASTRRGFDDYAIDNYAIVAEIQLVEYVPEGRTTWAVGNCLDLLHIDFEDAWYLAYPTGLQVFETGSGQTLKLGF